VKLDRLVRLYWLAISRRDLVAAAIIQARIASMPWRPEPDYPIFARRITPGERRAA
jgi:hypothetical protein